VLPEGWTPISFSGCYYKGFPHPSLAGICVHIRNKETGENKPWGNRIGSNEDTHFHFDPYLENSYTFQRLSCIEIYTQKFSGEFETMDSDQRNKIIGLRLSFFLLTDQDGKQKSLQQTPAKEASSFHIFMGHDRREIEEEP